MILQNKKSRYNSQVYIDECELCKKRVVDDEYDVHHINFQKDCENGFVKDKPHIFGGYTEATWDGGGIYKQDPNSFIFSLVNENQRPFKIKINTTQIYNRFIYHSLNTFTIFI